MLQIDKSHETRSLVSPKSSRLFLFVSVFIIAISGLIYELLAGALSSYLLGNSVTQFSLVIGFFLTAMGIGSLLSRRIKTNLLHVFFLVEILIGLIGGPSALLLFFAFTLAIEYSLILFLICILTGTLVGLEIPLLIRILQSQNSLRVTVGNVLALDYIGALFATLLFPLLLAPHLGLVRTGFLFGFINVSVAIVGMYIFRPQIKNINKLLIIGVVAGILQIVGFFTAGFSTHILEDTLYDDEIIFSKNTPYQRIIITRWRNDIRLFINGNIQFSSIDEFRYHEALVHPAMSNAIAPQQILLLGAGDGLAAREVLKYNSVQKIDIVDLDPSITQIFSTNKMLTDLNMQSLSNPKVHIFNEDAYKYLEKNQKNYDVIIIDLPDPNDEGLGKLYTRSFYRLVAKHLNKHGIMVTQATSPYYATLSFWCIVNTIAASNSSSQNPTLNTVPYHTYVPSFGNWGFVIASKNPIDIKSTKIAVTTKYLTNNLLPTLFVFPKDIGPRKTPINRLNNQVLIRLYNKGYKRWGH